MNDIGWHGTEIVNKAAAHYQPNLELDISANLVFIEVYQIKVDKYTMSQTLVIGHLISFQVVQIPFYLFKLTIDFFLKNSF
jgi:hypothetical protein